MALEGKLGVGKTTLLERSEEHATSAGVRVVRVPLHPDATAITGLRRTLVDDGPILITIDDAQWVHPDAIDIVAQLTSGAAGRQVAMLVTTRTPLHGPIARALGPVTTRCVEPLSAAGTCALIREGHPDAGAAFCAAAYQLTAGIPLLLVDLVAASVTLEPRDDERAAAVLERLAPGAIARTVHHQLARCGEAATLLAQALAVLGADGEIGLAAALAGLDVGAARAAADELFAAGFVAGGRPLRLRPAPVAAAILGELAPGRAERFRTAAATELVRRGDIEAAAVHLERVDPTGDTRVARVLQSAAARASDPACAAKLLARALREPPADTDRAAVLRDLGRAELALGDPAARVHLDAAAVLDPRDPGTRLALARAQLNGGDPDAALATLGGVLDFDIEDHDVRLRLEAELAAIGLMHPLHWRATEGRLDALGAPSRGDGPGARQLAAIRAFNAYRRAQPVELVRSYALAALVNREPDTDLLDGLAPLTMVTTALMACDELELARRLVHAGQHRAARLGNRVGASVMAWYAARIAYAAGDLHAADAGVISFHDPAHAPWVLPVANAQRALTCVALGEDERAAKALAEVNDEAVLGQLAYECILRARGTVLFAAGAAAGAAEAFEAGRDVMARYGIVNPAGCHFGGSGALALARTGDLERAREVAIDEWETAQAFGAPGTVGRALWVVASLDGDGDSLAEAAELLAEAGAWGARAAALVDLGDHLIETGRFAEARPVLYDALDLADRDGAEPLARRARTALHRAGARPRRARLRGSHALTAAERRSAVLAADGLSNADIAAALFLSVKTVEGHLRRAYRKLGITERAELARALAGD
jgi:DNA-binding CsgD family transcriptional regulator